MGRELGFESLEDLANKVDWEGGPAEMIGYCGLGAPDTVEPLNELADGLGDAFAQLKQGLDAINEILPEPEGF